MDNVWGKRQEAYLLILYAQHGNIQRVFRRLSLLAIHIAICYTGGVDADRRLDQLFGSERAMNLAEKLRALRAQEGLRRGLWRSLTQREVANALRQELGFSFSQAYLSQLEGGKRTHLTNTSREALARFYHVHPGFLVNDLADTSFVIEPQTAHTSLPSLRDAFAPHSQPRGQAAPSILTAPKPFTQVTPQPPTTHDGWFGWLAHSAPAEHLEAMGLLGAARDRPDLRRVLTLMEALLRLPDDRLRVIEVALGLAPSTGETQSASTTANDQAGADTQQAALAPRRSARED